MVQLLTIATVSSVVLSSLAPGAQAAPAMPPLPMRQEARRSMLNSGDMDFEKRDLKIKGCFDPDHSLHWNYRRGCASEDGHGHGWHGAKERRTIDLEAIIQLNSKTPKRSLLGLNLGGDDGLLGNKNSKGLLGTKGLGLNLRKEKRGKHIHAHGLSDHELKRLIRDHDGDSHIHIHAHREKRSVDADEEEDDGEYADELEKRSPEPRSRYRHGRHRHRHDHGHDHSHVHIHKRDEIEARDPRHHHDDHYHHSDHVHVHSHKRDEIEETEELEKRSKSEPKRFERKSKKSKGKKSSSKSAKSFKKTDSKKNSKKSKSKGSSSKSASKKATADSKPAVSAKVSLGKRALEQAGVPGFVEVATPLFNSSLARSIAGLVFTANPDTSPNATTFVLGTSDAESTQFYLTTASNPDPSTPVELNVVNIRVPILDSQTLKVVDYCATFDLTPPSPLSLLPCGKKDGFSQNFAYNGTTGEVQPLYSTTPAPMALVSNKASQAATSAQSFAATDSNSTAAAQPEEEDPEDISLYFIPASTYYEAPSHVDNLIDSHKNRTLAASMTSSDDGMTATSEDAQPTSTEIPTSTDSATAADATMTAAPVEDGSQSATDDYSTEDSSSMDSTAMDASATDSSSMDSSSMDSSMDSSAMEATASSTMDDSMATPTDSLTTDEPLSTSTVEATPSSTPVVNQNNAATPSSSMVASSSSSSMPMASASSSASASASSMTPSGTASGSASMASASSTSTSSSANASPTVTIQASDYTTPGMTSDPNAGIDANASNYSPMKMARRRRFARW